VQATHVYTMVVALQLQIFCPRAPLAVSGPQPFAQAGSVPVQAVTLSCNPEGHAPASVPPPPLPVLESPPPPELPPVPEPPLPAEPPPLPELPLPELAPVPVLAPLAAPVDEGLLSLLHPGAATPATNTAPRKIDLNEGTLIVVSFADSPIRHMGLRVADAIAHQRAKLFGCVEPSGRRRARFPPS
jgi:hypothetical protein